MYDVLGTLLPLSLAIAMSPVPVIVAVLMLLSERARVKCLAFLLGWAIAIVVVVSALTAVAKLFEVDAPGAPNPVAAALRGILGIILIILAVRTWRKRGTGEKEAEMPAWMASITTSTPGRSFSTGLLLAVANPKNVIVSAAAAIAIGTGGLGFGSIALSIAIFTLLSSATIIVPLVAYLLSPRRAAKSLRTLELWLAQNSGALMAVILLVFGVLLIGDGISSL